MLPECCRVWLATSSSAHASVSWLLKHRCVSTVLEGSLRPAEPSDAERKDPRLANRAPLRSGCEERAIFEGVIAGRWRGELQRC